MEKELKWAFTFILAVVMLGATVVGALAMSESDLATEGTVGVYPASIEVIDGKLAVDEEQLYQPTFLESFIAGFGIGQPFNFVDLQSDNPGSYSCTYQNKAGPFFWDNTKNIRSGAQCAVGDFITYKFESTSSNGRYIFDNMWKKGASDDLPNFLNYYTKNIAGGFDYSYSCYECAISIVDDFEKGCLTADKQQCVKASDSRCDIEYDFELQCLQHVDTGSNDPDPDPNPVDNTPVTPDINIYAFSVSESQPIQVGQVYTIVGYAKVTGDFNGAVIETGFEEYGQPLSTISISSEQSGACGDDDTVGAKFNANDGDTIRFVFKDKATTAGNFKIPIYATNGCYATLGSSMKILDEETFNLRVVEPANGGTTPPTTTDPDTVTCFSCQDGEVSSGTYDGTSCPTGASSTDDIECNVDTTPPVVQPTIVDCYVCQGDRVVQQQFEGASCPEGTSITEEVDCGSLPPPPCETDPTAPACNPLPTNDECDADPTLPECQGAGYVDCNTYPELCVEEQGFIDKYFDFSGNPAQAWGLTAMIVIILGLIVYLLLPGGKKKGGL